MEYLPWLRPEFPTRPNGEFDQTNQRQDGGLQGRLDRSEETGPARGRTPSRSADTVEGVLRLVLVVLQIRCVEQSRRPVFLLMKRLHSQGNAAFLG